MSELIRMTVREQKEETRRKVPGTEKGSESEEEGEEVINDTVEHRSLQLYSLITFGSL